MRKDTTFTFRLDAVLLEACRRSAARMSGRHAKRVTITELMITALMRDETIAREYGQLKRRQLERPQSETGSA